jgi:CheY-like chemotaxis protein
MLRAQPGGGDLFIVVVTARADRGDEDKARAVGADAFLRKPVSGDELAAVLADA